MVLTQSKHRNAVPTAILGLIVITVVDLAGATLVRIKTGQAPTVLGDVAPISATALAGVATMGLSRQMMKDALKKEPGEE